MILPIVAYGSPILRKAGREIDKEYPHLQELIANMFETMQKAPGVGLAAPQVGHSISLFIVDASPFAEEEDNKDNAYLKSFKKVFINAEILKEQGEEEVFEEGCLSIPTIREDVMRKPGIRIQYFDKNFKFHEESFNGIPARIIQHEYDHIEGILFTDHLNPLKKRLLKKKLREISRGIVKVSYKMKFTLKKVK